MKNREYLVYALDKEGGLRIRHRVRKPSLGGYLSEQKYGDPDYCPTGTRLHLLAFKKDGYSRNLVWFDSVKAAVYLGFSPCQNCFLKGENIMDKWQEYLSACGELDIKPIPTPERILKSRRRKINL